MKHSLDIGLSFLVSSIFSSLSQPQIHLNKINKQLDFFLPFIKSLHMFFNLLWEYISACV